MTTERELIRRLLYWANSNSSHEMACDCGLCKLHDEADAYLATPEVDAMYGQMSEVDFDSDTVTFKMEPGYHAAAGRFKIVRAPAQQQESKT